MKSDKKMRRISILTLLLAVVALTMGFAAFSSTLVIDTGADVKADSSIFKLVLYGYDYSKNAEPDSFDELSTTISDPFKIVGASSASTASINNDRFAISNLHATFTRSNQSVSYSFLVNNEGEYDAYLNSLIFDKIENMDVKKQCVPSPGVTESLFNAACGDIVLSIKIGDNTYYDTTDLNYQNIVIPKGEFLEFFVNIEYIDDGNLADGDFSVKFGAIKLNFSTTS